MIFFFKFAVLLCSLDIIWIITVLSCFQLGYKKNLKSQIEKHRLNLHFLLVVFRNETYFLSLPLLLFLVNLLTSLIIGRYHIKCYELQLYFFGSDFHLLLSVL